jgi:ATP-dependent Clp protease ATP-binding subunit ClpA
MKLDDLTNQVYVVAVNEARLHGHEYITPEHFLYSALMFDDGKRLVSSSGGELAAIGADLAHFFDAHLPKKITEQPSESFSLVQMFEQAALRAQVAGKGHIGIGDFLSAMFSLKESYAEFILAKNGMDKHKLIRQINSTGKNIEENADENMPAQAQGVQDAPLDAQLAAYTVDLCALARAGKLDPLVGREEELDRTVQILCRRLKNNPVHVGAPGVGKTAVVEGLAQRIVSGDVPAGLKNVTILRLDMGLLLAGTRYRGDFEERLVKLLQLAAALPNPIIYIDEIHTVVGTGAIAGSSMDATSIIKPYLTRGEIRFIGSTTHEEYKKYFEKDRALARRFARIDINEPTETECVEILRGLAPHYEKHHRVKYPQDALGHIVRLAARHMNDRFLPDKAIDVLDEAGVQTRLYNEAKKLPRVTNKIIEQVVSRMAKVPPGHVGRDEKTILAKLEKNLNACIFGQEDAVKSVVYAIHSARAGLNEAERPVANLLFAGPTGVGKTELARQLAVCLGIPLTRFDMSEYQERHATARLIGAPPGYVGYDEGGLLTDAIRKTPHCVLLLDEIEKAHADILNVLLQVMDYGVLTDNNGKKADFNNVIIIMTSNAGARELSQRTVGFEGGLDAGRADKAVEGLFSPEFRGRLDAIVRFNAVDKKMAIRIAHQALERLGKKLALRGITFTATDEAAAHIAHSGHSEKYGARDIIRIVENDVKRLLTGEILFGALKNGGNVTLNLQNQKLAVTFS